ncbi:MAG: AAA family ATPase [bacterium]
MEKLTPQEWQQTEARVDEAETQQRAADKASQDLYRETGLPKISPEPTDRYPEVVQARNTLPNEEVVNSSSSPRQVKKALEREEAFGQLAEATLGPDDSPERALVGWRKRNMIAAMRRQAMLEELRQDLLNEESAYLRKIKGQPTGSELDALEEIRQELAGLDQEQEQLLKSTPEAYYGLHLNELKEYKGQLEQGKLVETDYVKERAEDIVVHLHAGKPVMIYGHLGTGKTELAMHIAREYIGKEALVVSGSKHTSLAELYGHQVLAIDRIDPQELDGFIGNVERKFNEWEEQNPQAPEEDKSRSHDRILQTYLAGLKGGTISEFFLGPIYRAMQEGRPVIIDEVNAIPHEVLISLNHILTRKVGDRINVQQDSGMEVEVGEGFGVMMTGNLNQGQERYIDRQDMDPALLSRLYKVEYDYLPQKTEGRLEDEAGKENELFHLLIAEVMDKNGNIEGPKDSVKKLWNLAKAARLTQDVFAGRAIQSAYYFKEAGGRAARYVLKESVLSLRALNHVMTQWQQEGYRNELDYYLWKEFVSQSTIASDRAYLYQLLKDQFGFFQSPGWDQNPNYGSGGMVESFNVVPPQNQAPEKEFIGPRKTVDVAFGNGPERTDWPEQAAIGTESSMELTEKLAQLEEWKTNFEQEIKNLETQVEETCQLEGAPGAGQANA